jgi:site-specific recombinase XerD
MTKNKISKFNQNAIEKFMKYQQSQFDNAQTLYNHKNYLNMLFSKTNKKYTEIKLDDIITILSQVKPTTAETMKPTIRNFFKYYNRSDIAEHIPSNSKVLARQTKGKEAVLTPEEINKIIEAPKELRDKAIIETFLTTGIRNNELRNIKLSDIDINDNITTWVTIHRTKTNTTNVEERIPIVPNPDNPIARFPTYLRQWYKINKHLPQSTHLFYSKSRNKYHQQLSKRGIQIIIENAHKHSEINKTITPHIFRHTAATYDGKILVRNLLCQKYGWKENSRMLEKYCHHDEIQLEDQLLKLAGLTEEEKTKGRKCPNCGEINNIHEETCTKCHQILNPDKLNEIYENNLKTTEDLNKTKENYYRDKTKYEKDIEHLKNTIKKQSATIESLIDKKLAERHDQIMANIFTIAAKESGKDISKLIEDYNKYQKQHLDKNK